MEKRLRTFILRKVPPATTTMTIFNGLTKVLKHQDISSIIRDELDTRRFYVTFANKRVKQSVLEHGFKTRGFSIKPQKYDFAGFMPYPPPFLTDEQILEHLTTFGEVVDYRFQTAPGSETRIGGLEFKLCLKEDLRVWPTFITADGIKHRIFDRDDRQQCFACKKYGHIQRNCWNASIEPQLQQSEEDELTIDVLQSDAEDDDE